MKLVFITYHYLNGNGGGVFASRAFINAFAQIADDMTLLFPMKDGAEPECLNTKVKLVPVWDRRSIISKALGLFTGRNNRFEQCKAELEKTHYDVAVFDTCMSSPGLIEFFKEKGTRIITIHHNYQYEYYRDNTGPLLYIPTLFWVQRFERAAVRLSDLNLTLTESDRQLLKEHYGKGQEVIEVIGAFEYSEKIHPVYDDIESPKFLITGNLGAVQTEKSLLPWIDEYYPLLKEFFPEATLEIAGKNPSPRLVEKARGNGIRVIPNPESMEPILAKAHYYICPTALGGGLKLRVMDGLSAGLPVVCHEVSARGYEEFEKNGALFVYKDKDSFRSCLSSLKSCNVDKKGLICLYERLFSFASGLKRLKDIVE